MWHATAICIPRPLEQIAKERRRKGAKGLLGLDEMAFLSITFTKENLGEVEHPCRIACFRAWTKKGFVYF